ncbi:MAG: hypothetical protein KA023_11080, partial [Bacteroidales bacterium]|nr:hypothetical protein [Bacteroidales bacterium]
VFLVCEEGEIKESLKYIRVPISISYQTNKMLINKTKVYIRALWCGYKLLGGKPKKIDCCFKQINYCN